MWEAEIRRIKVLDENRQNLAKPHLNRKKLGVVV
jgi:hypothetical protein